MISLFYFRSLTNTLSQFEGWLKIIHVKAHGFKQLRQRLSRHYPGEALMANHFANHGPVLLLNPCLVIFVMRSGTSERYAVLCAIGCKRVVDGVASASVRDAFRPPRLRGFNQP